MADGYDRDNEGNGGGSFVMGLLTGTVLGAGLGLLFAPRAGAELRGELGKQAGNLANTASEGYRKASDAVEEGYRKAADAVGETYRRASEATGETYRKASEATEDGYRQASATAGEWAERGREVYGKVREAAAHGVDEAEKYVRDATSGIGSSQSSSGPRRS